MSQIPANFKSLIAQSIFSVVCSIALAVCFFGQTKINSSIPLTTEKAIERELKGGEAHLYNIALTAGQYLQVEIEQKGVDVVVTLLDSNDRKLAKVDSSTGGMQGPKPLLFIADAAGKYRLEVRSFEKTASDGRYEVKIKELRAAATEKDKKSFVAQQTFSEAQQLQKQGTAESLRGAIKKYEEAVTFYRAAEDREGEATALTNIGVTYSFLGENDKSLDYLKKSLQLSRDIGYKRGEAIALDELGWFYSGLGENQKSLENFKQAFSLLDIARDRTVKIEALVMMGKANYSLGENLKALKNFQDALLLFRIAGSKEAEATALNEIGLVYNDLGQYEKALDSYNESLRLKKAAGNKSEIAITQQNIGLVYSLLGDYKRAIDYFTQALPNQEGNNKAATLSNIGYAYFQLGENQKALEYLTQTLSLYKNLKNNASESRTVSLIGDVNYKLKENQKALKFYTEGLQLARASGDKISESWTLKSIGKFYSDSGEYGKALDYYNQALAIQTTVGDIRGKARTLDEMRSVWSSLGNPRQAIFYGKQSVNTYQQVRQTIKRLDKHLQQAYVKTVEPAYRSLADVLISEGLLLEAQAVLDLLKEEEFNRIVSKSGEPLYTLPYSVAEEEAIKIVERLALTGRELSELKAKTALSAEEKTRLDYLERTEIPAANKALRLAIEALSNSAPDVKNVLDARMKDNIQNILPALGKGVVALYTVVGKTGANEIAEEKTAVNNSAGKADNKNANNKINIGWILLVTPEFRKAYPIDTTDLEQTVFRFREALRSPYYDAQPLAAELYKKLFLQVSEKQKSTLAADLETYLGKEKDKTLMWSLDGVLRYVPMAALHNGKQYLVEKYRNAVFNTASLGSLKDSAKSNWEVVGLGVSTEGTVKAFDGRTLRFAALKDSEIELNSLVKEKDGKDANGIFPGTLKIDKDFTKEALFEGAGTGAPVIHISSHFWFNPAQEKTSFLLLGNADRLEVAEFQDYPNLFREVDFLSLSACDTATGGASTATEKTDNKESNGKEVEGFAYVAQTLGAKSVMASLWQVSALGTKELMLKFYQIKKEQPELPKGEALRQAQLALLRGTIKAREASGGEKGIEVGIEEQKRNAGLKPFKKDAKAPLAHPYYWSSFILIGNWK